MNKKILIAVTNTQQYDKIDEKTGYWLSELAHFYHTFKQAGYEIVYVSPKGGAASLDQNSVKFSRDEISQNFYKDPQEQEKLKHTKMPSEINPNDFCGIYYPGGHGPMWDIANNEEIAKIATNIYEHGGVVAAVCHGSAGLLPIKLSDGNYIVRNKTVTGFTNMEEKLIGKSSLVPFLLEDALKLRGAKFKRSLPFLKTHYEVDGRLVTGQNPKSAHAVAEQTLLVLNANQH